MTFDAPSTRAFVRTVLGDVAPGALGSVDYHEHLFHASPLLPGDDLIDEKRSAEEAADFAASGFTTLVDATPVHLGRRPSALAKIAVTSAVTIVATTGRHRDAHYGATPWMLEFTADRLAAMFTRELVVGMAADDADYERGLEVPVATHDGAAVRAGVLKAGIDYWSITTAERRSLEGVAAAHRSTGAPVMVHTEYCSAATDVLDILTSEGVEPNRVVLAHADRNPDPGLHAEIAARGAFVGYDGAGRHREWPDSVVIDCLADVVERGYGDRVLLGADVARSSRFRSHGGMPGLEYLGRSFVPRLRDRLGEEAVDLLLHDNPAGWLTWSAGAQTATHSAGI